MARPQEMAAVFGGQRPTMNDSADASMLARREFPSLRNIDPFYHELRRRNGRERVFVTDIQPADPQAVGQVTSLIPYDITSGGVRYTGLLATDGRYFWTITGGVEGSKLVAIVDGDGNDPLASAAGEIWRGMNYGSFLYLTNGTYKPLMMAFVSTVATLYQAGIEKPTVDSATYSTDAPGGGGNFVAGDIIYVRWAFRNPTTGVTSNPSAVAAAADSIGTLKVTIGGGHTNFNLTAISEPEQTGATQIVIYRTVSSQTAITETEFYEDGVITSDLASDDEIWDQVDSGRTDAALVSATAMFTDTDNARTERDTPPMAKMAVAYNQRGWYAGAGADDSPYTALTSGQLLFSDNSYPEYVAFTDQQSQHYDGVDLPVQGDIQGMAVAGDSLVVASPDATITIIGQTPQFGALLTGKGDGCVAIDAMISGAKFAFFLSKAGAFAHTGGSATSLTDGVLDGIYTSLDATYLPNAQAQYYPKKRQVWFFVPSSGSTVNDTVLVYQLPGSEGQGGWGVYDGYKMKASCVAKAVASSSLEDRMYVVDDNNILYLCDEGDTDGADDIGTDMASTSAALSGTVLAGGADTMTSAGTFYIANEGLDGAPIWVWDADGNNAQLRWVKSNTNTTITVNANWDTNPASGWSYAVGGIGYKFITGGVTHTEKGFMTLRGRQFQAHIDRNGYTGSDTVFCSLLRDGATAITTGDTKKTLPLGDTDGITDWPGTKFGSAQAQRAGQLQIMIENYGIIPIRMKKCILSFQAFDITHGT